jgi:hypothetical protein
MDGQKCLFTGAWNFIKVNVECSEMDDSPAAFRLLVEIAVACVVMMSVFGSFLAAMLLMRNDRSRRRDHS